MVLKMRSGAVGTVEASKVATGTCEDFRFEIHGTEGALRWDAMDSNWLEAYSMRDDEAQLGGNRGFKRIECVHSYPEPGGKFPGKKFPPGWIRAHLASLYNFVECIGAGRQASPSFREGAELQKVMDLAYESAKTGKWMDTSEVMS
jgi:predicted dehydrogenase